MAYYCQGGTEFDGYKLTTDRDKQLCKDSGGEVVNRPDPVGNGGCSGGTVQNFSATTGNTVDVNPLYAGRSFFAHTLEVTLLKRLGDEAKPAVESILLEDRELANEMVKGLEQFSAAAARLLDPEVREEPIYTSELHEQLTNLAIKVAERDGGEEVRELVREAINLGEELKDVSAVALRERLGGMPEPPPYPDPSDTELEVTVPVGGAGFTTWHSKALHVIDPSSPIEDVWKDTPVVVSAAELRAASEKIDEKAASLGADRTGARVGTTSRIDGVQGGFVQRFEECNIYYSEATGAHEVRSEILRKYLFLNGPVALGLPLTDEEGCPDGRGRFNHFSRTASIYWTDTTGPFHVQGPVRMRWASEGWETGELGYPVRDMQSLGGLTPADNPDMRWTHFQNGIVFSQFGDGRRALLVQVDAEQVRHAIYRAFDRRLVKHTYTAGLITFEVRPGLFSVDPLGVDDWQYDFYGAIPRTLRLRIRGFVSVPVASDPTFEIDIGLRFETTWPMSFTFPPFKTLVARLISSTIRVNGIFSGEIASQIKESLESAFAPTPSTGPALVIGDVKTGANQQGKGNLDFLDVMLMADGALRVYVNPLPPLAGVLRERGAQVAIENALANI